MKPKNPVGLGFFEKPGFFWALAADAGSKRSNVNESFMKDYKIFRYITEYRILLKTYLQLKGE